MSKTDAIGVFRAHRWTTIEVQKQRLEQDGCRVIVDLNKTPRETLIGWAREKTVIKAVYAFLIARDGEGVHMLNDYQRFAEKLAKLPRGCSAAIKDVDTGLLADTAGTRRAMLALVKAQIARHRQGIASAENGKQGGQEKQFTELELAKGEAAWRNVRKFPTWDDVAPELEKINEELTVWYAHRLWGPRKFGVKKQRD
jgi:hypothetical protein